ncbi:SMI1/KNR4 family protein [Streptomyces sp. NPDC014685]|uniref:SMI1/KNR4 family protein n=1 Tax=Streptomyces sp. NPDC014685 TaxID=3364881 RepID=UPI0036FDAFBB
MTSMLSTWPRVLRLLQDRAPASARCLRKPATHAQISDAQQELGLTFPQDLVDSLLLADGVNPDPRASFLLPPFYLPTCLERTINLWKMKVAVSGQSADDGESSKAGSNIQGFSKSFVPIGDDTSGDLLVLDLRPGKLNGCVLTWSKVDGHFGHPTWSCMEEMWSDVADALETGTQRGSHESEDPHLTRNGCSAVFTSTGSVEWEF